MNKNEIRINRSILNDITDNEPISVFRFFKISESIIITSIKRSNNNNSKEDNHPYIISKNNNFEIIIKNNLMIRNLSIRFALQYKDAECKQIISGMSIKSSSDEKISYSFNIVEPETDYEYELCSKIYCLDINISDNTEYNADIILDKLTDVNKEEDKTKMKYSIYVKDTLRNLKLYKVIDEKSFVELEDTKNIDAGDKIAIQIDRPGYDKLDMEKTSIVIYDRNELYQNIDITYEYFYDKERGHIIQFYMPDFNIIIKNIEFISSYNNGVIDYFEIPDELAKELSDNLIKQTIRQRTLAELVNDPDKYDAAEKLLIPVVSKVEAIKVQITNKYVPEKYRSNEYMWNYDGYEIDKNKVQIHKIN